MPNYSDYLEYWYVNFMALHHMPTWTPIAFVAACTLIAGLMVSTSKVK